MNELPTELLLRRMFTARAVVLVAGAVLIGIDAMSVFADSRLVLPEARAPSRQRVRRPGADRERRQRTMRSP